MIPLIDLTPLTGRLKQVRRRKLRTLPPERLRLALTWREYAIAIWFGMFFASAVAVCCWMVFGL